MLGYTAKDLEEMTNSIHDVKLYYLLNKGKDMQQGDEDTIVDGLLKTMDFLQGLWAEGYFDNA